MRGRCCSLFVMGGGVVVLWCWCLRECLRCVELRALFPDIILRERDIHESKHLFHILFAMRFIGNDGFEKYGKF